MGAIHILTVLVWFSVDQRQLLEGKNNYNPSSREVEAGT